VGEYVLESLARVPVEVEYASEFRYRKPILFPDERTLENMSLHAWEIQELKTLFLHDAPAFNATWEAMLADHAAKLLKLKDRQPNTTGDITRMQPKIQNAVKLAATSPITGTQHPSHAQRALLPAPHSPTTGRAHSSTRCVAPLYNMMATLQLLPAHAPKLVGLHLNSMSVSDGVSALNRVLNCDYPPSMWRYIIILGIPLPVLFHALSGVPKGDQYDVLMSKFVNAKNENGDNVFQKNEMCNLDAAVRSVLLLKPGDIPATAPAAGAPLSAAAQPLGVAHAVAPEQLAPKSDAAAAKAPEKSGSAERTDEEAHGGCARGEPGGLRRRRAEKTKAVVCSDDEEEVPPAPLEENLVSFEGACVFAAGLLAKANDDVQTPAPNTLKRLKRHQ
jgi:hypothetical protein